MSEVIHINLSVLDKFNITGRGTIIVVNLRNTGHTKLKWVKELPTNIGDKIAFKNNEIYTITGIEVKRNLTTGKINSESVGLLVK